jgi:hypothetical protein
MLDREELMVGDLWPALQGVWSKLEEGMAEGPQLMFMGQRSGKSVLTRLIEQSQATIFVTGSESWYKWKREAQPGVGYPMKPQTAVLMRGSPEHCGAQLDYLKRALDEQPEAVVILDEFCWWTLPLKPSGGG